jgi:DNA repair photolyase
MYAGAGLKRADWENWGRFTTFKSNAAELLRAEVRPRHRIYCSPLVDPYQPAEEQEQLMPRIYKALLEVSQPKVFVVQTRGPLILRDIEWLQTLAAATTLRVSFSLTTDREDVRRWYEPLCAPVHVRLDTIRQLRETGIEVYATLAPILPCNPENLVRIAIEATGRDLIADPFHVRPVKHSGAITREAACRISHVRGFEQWHAPTFHEELIGRMKTAAAAYGHRLEVGVPAFSWLSRDPDGTRPS